MAGCRTRVSTSVIGANVNPVKTEALYRTMVRRSAARVIAV